MSPERVGSALLRAMGVELVVAGATRAELAAVATLFGEWERVFSRFRPDSELSRVNALDAEAFVASPLFVRLLRTALAAAAATDGLVVSSGKEVLPGFDDTPVNIRYDVVYLLDDRGWYYRYSHLASIDPAIRPGVKVKMGQAIGVLGKEGGSGGWAHLHFEAVSRQPSGEWGTQEGYALEYVVRYVVPTCFSCAAPYGSGGPGA